MKSLSQHINESFFHTEYGIKEVVQFRPNSSHISQYGLENNDWIIGKIEEITIGETQQYYGISDINGRYYDGIPEGNINQDMNAILTSNIRGINRAKHPLEDILDMNQ